MQPFKNASQRIKFKDYGYFPDSSFFFCILKQMSTVGITENVKGDNKKFEIWYNGREEVYIIQVMTIFFFFPRAILPFNWIVFKNVHCPVDSRNNSNWKLHCCTGTEMANLLWKWSGFWQKKSNGKFLGMLDRKARTGFKICGNFFILKSVCFAQSWSQCSSPWQNWEPVQVRAAQWLAARFNWICFALSFFVLRHLLLSWKTPGFQRSAKSWQDSWKHAEVGLTVSFPL